MKKILCIVVSIFSISCSNSEYKNDSNDLIIDKYIDNELSERILYRDSLYYELPTVDDSVIYYEDPFNYAINFYRILNDKRWALSRAYKKQYTRLCTNYYMTGLLIENKHLFEDKHLLILEYTKPFNYLINGILPYTLTKINDSTFNYAFKENSGPGFSTTYLYLPSSEGDYVTSLSISLSKDTIKQLSFTQFDPRYNIKSKTTLSFRYDSRLLKKIIKNVKNNDGSNKEVQNIIEYKYYER